MINIFKRRKNNKKIFQLDDFFSMQKYVWEMYSILGLNEVDKTHYKNYYKAIKNNKTLCFCDLEKDISDRLEKRKIYNNMIKLGLVVETTKDNFSLTNRGLNILQGLLLKEIKTSDIKILETPIEIDNIKDI